MSNVQATATDVLERIDDAFFALDEQWRFTYLNEQAEEVLGVDSDDILGEVVWEAFEPAVGTTFQKEYERAMATQQQVSFEEYYPPLSMWLEVTAYPSESGLSVYFRDVTDRVERERELEQYETVVETVEDGIYVVDEDGTFTMVNDAYAEILGYDREELLGSNVSMVVDRETAEQAASLESELRAGTRDTATLEAAIERKDGREIEAEATFSLLPTGDRVGVVRNVTERAQRERELHRVQDLLEQTKRIANVGGWEIDPESMDVFWSENLYDILGVEHGEEPSLEDALDVYVEEDRQDVAEAVERGLDGEHFEVEARIERPDGEIRWLRIQGEPKVEDREVTLLRGAVQDITEQKKREQRLELYERVVATVEDGVYAVDNDDTFVMVNDAFCEMTGYDRSELLGEPSTMIKDESVRQQADQLVAELADGRRTKASLEFDLRPADGDGIPVESRFDRFEFDDSIGRCGVVREMADRKRFERQLVEIHEISRSLVRAGSNDEIIDIATDALREVLDAPAALYFEYDEARDELGPPVVDDPSDILDIEIPAVTPDEQSITGLVYESGEARYVPDVQDLPQYEQPHEGAPIQSAIAAPVGDEGVLGAIAAERGAFDEQMRQLVEIVATNVSAALDRVADEQQLRHRVVQQEGVTEFGKLALTDRDIDELMADATRLIAETLGTDYCKVLDLEASGEQLLLRQGVGWDEGIVGNTRISATADDSQAAHTLANDEPIVVSDLDTETRFSGPALLTEHDVTSGISTIIGPIDDPWGILSAHDTDSREFSEYDVNFLQSIANILASAIERHMDEVELRERRDQLAALNDINSLVHSLSESMFGLSSKNEIEQLVCDRLGASDSYEFAWVGATDDGTVVLDAEAGVEGYLDGLDLSIDDPAGEPGPTAMAHRTGEMQVIQDVRTDPRYEQWREHAESYGYHASASIPIADGEMHGTLNVYSTRPDAFDGEERDALRRLGSVVAYALSSVERDRELQRERNRLEFMNRLLRHNLLNSLNVVKARLDLLDGRVDYEVHDDLEVATDRTQEMIDFVQTVRKVTKVIGRGKEQELEPQPIDDVLESRVVRAQQTYPDAAFHLESLPSADVIADDLLGEVLDNILINAVQHNPVEEPQIWIDTSADEACVTVTIADDGPGIPDDRKDAIFDRESMDLHDPGSGFGLYLVGEIVASYGGEITVDDNEHGGATFRLTFERPAD